MLMKFLLTAALALAVAAPALADSTGGKSNISTVSGVDRSGMTTAEGSGVVKAVDTKAGTVTIQHGPIAALKWPAMTMAFKVNPRSLLGGVNVGQSVKFTLMQMGGTTQLTAIQPK
jgi:Cu(I)/Ag(I) efflux system protein CusF